MKILDRTLSAGQTGILLFVLLFANKILILPELLFDGAKFEAVFIPVFSFCLELALLWLFYRVKRRFPQQSFSQILRDHCGKIVKIVIYIFFAVFFLSKAVLLYNVTFIFFRNLIYKDSGSFLFLFCLIPIINHLCICGLRTMARTLQIFFPVILTVTIFCVVVGVFGIGQGPLLFQASFSQWAVTALKHISPYGDTIFLFLIMDKVQIHKGQWKFLFLLATLAAFLICLVTFVFVLSYTYTSFMHPYAIFEIMSFVKEYGGLGRIDIISMALIIIFTYFHLALYMKGFLIAFDVIFPRIDQIFGVLAFDTAFLLIVNFFIINLETAVVYGEEILPYAIIFPYVVLPLVVLLIRCIRKNNKDSVRKNRNNFLRKKHKIEKAQAVADEKQGLDETKRGPAKAANFDYGKEKSAAWEIVQ